MATKNDIVRLKTPESVDRTGKPEAFIVKANGQTYRLPWGADFRLSHHTDPDNKVGNMDARGGYRLLHSDFYDKYKSKFKPINNED